MNITQKKRMFSIDIKENCDKIMSISRKDSNTKQNDWNQK